MLFTPVRFVMLLLAAWVTPLQAADSDHDAAKEIEMRIEQAREQLDEAARKLADLHTEMWQLETTGPRADRPMLGVLLDNPESPAGLTLAGVTPEGGAEKAGIQAGDTIVVVNGKRLDAGGGEKPLDALQEALAPIQAGEAVPVTYRRGGETFSVTVVTESRGRYMDRMVKEKQGPWIDSLLSLKDLEDLEALEGLQQLELLEDLDAAGLGEDLVRAPAGLRLYELEGDLAGYFGVDRGVVVLEAPQRITALKAGDVLLDIDGKAVSDPTASLKRLAAADGNVAVRIKRQGEVRDVTLDADAMNAEQSLHLFQGDRQVRIQRGADGKAAKIEIMVNKD